jgi:hypothetical protein
LGADKIPFRTWLGIFCVLLPIFLILFISIPSGEITQTIDLPAIEFPLSDYRTQGEAPVSAMQEPRQLVITFPKQIRLGDTRNVKLILDIPPTAGSEGTPSSTSSGLADIYQDNNLVAEARLDLPGFEVSPFGELSSPIAPGKSLNLNWEISPNQKGIYAGNLWFYINIFPKEGGEKERQALFAVPLHIQCSPIFGLSTTTMRGFSGVLFLLGAGLIISSVFKKQKNH